MSNNDTRKDVGESALLERYKRLGRKIEKSISDSGIERAQIERKKIRDKLVEEHGWSRKKANELCE